MLGRLKVGQRLRLGFGLMMAGGLCLALLTALQFQRFKQAADDVSLQRLPAVARLAELDGLLQSIRRSQLEILFEFDRDKRQGKARQGQDQLARFLSEAPASLALNDAGGWPDLLRTFADVGRQIPALAGNLAQAETLRQLVTQQAAQAGQALQDQLSLAVHQEMARARRSADEGDRIQRSVRLSLAAFSSGFLLLGALLTWRITHSTVAPLGEASRAARRMAGGDLQSGPATPQGGEIGELQDSLTTMRSGLGHLVTDIRRTSDSVRHAAEEMAQGYADLSVRTENGALGLQGILGSVQQLGHNADEGHRLGERVSTLAAKAGESVEQGSQVVQEVVQTMGGIEEASLRIADIINVIDGIAFQTNLLALNAAVEAARAGEQGRGFAVVAHEVRTLAQRAGTAAHEIKRLILDSRAKVEEGSRLVGRTGQTMGDIRRQVLAVSGLLDDMRSGLAAQNGHVQQIAQAVQALDGSTQQNAALVEQGSAAADSLRHQSRQLTEVVAVFRLDASALPVG
ncbi:MAG: HAMP domain-containing protein [Curvibacter sp.]|nr:HAMP domain-containing protein [Curvibacter sp.]